MQETPNENLKSDLDAFSVSPPSQKLDDKAAILESQLNEMKANFNRERFCWLSAILLSINVIVDVLVAAAFGKLACAAVTFFLAAGSCLLMTIIGRHLGFEHLEEVIAWNKSFRERLPKKLPGFEP